MSAEDPNNKHPDPDPEDQSSSDSDDSDDEVQESAGVHEQDPAGTGSNKPANLEVPTMPTAKDVGKFRRSFLQRFVLSWSSAVKAETLLEEEDFEEGVRNCMVIDTQSSEPTYLHSIVAENVLDMDQKKFLFRIAFGLNPSHIHQTGGKELHSPLHLATLSDPTWVAKGLKSRKKKKKDVDHQGVAKMPNEEEEKDEPALVPFICNLMKDTLSEAAAAAAIGVPDAYGDTCLHIAIRRDIVGVLDLINLSDKMTLEKKHTGQDGALGNTPLHNALDFQWYDVEAPTCRTKELLEGMDLDEPAVSSSKSLKNGERESACQSCRVRNRRYRDTKKRRREIIDRILRSCPDSLAIRNGSGLSPYLYHQLTRENALRKMHSNGTSNPVTKNGPLPTPATSEEPPFGGLQRVSTLPQLGTDSGPESFDKQQKNPKGNTDKLKAKGNAAAPSSKTIPAPSLQPSIKRPHVSGDCQDPKRHHLSDETMKLLIEKSFSLGGRYRDAYQCLFRDGNLDTNDQENARRNSWEPPRRITPQTIKSYDFLEFEPMMALLRIRLTPEPLIPGRPQSRRRIQAGI